VIAETFGELLRDPAHWLFELFLMALFDGLIFGLGAWYIKRWLKRRHAEFDEAHEITHTEGEK
jgi:pantothenate kinase